MRLYSFWNQCQLSMSILGKQGNVKDETRQNEITKRLCPTYYYHIFYKIQHYYLDFFLFAVIKS